MQVGTRLLVPLRVLRISVNMKNKILLLKIFKNRSGQTLLEALIALSILVVILGAVATSVLTSINNSSFVKQQNQANKLAQQGIEYIRDRINNSGVNRFATYNGYATINQTWCLGDVTTACSDPAIDCHFTQGLCSTANVQTLFKREVTFLSTNCGINGLSVTVSVSWIDGKCAINSFCHSQKVTSCFIDPSKSLPVDPNGTPSPVGI